MTNFYSLMWRRVNNFYSLPWKRVIYFYGRITHFYDLRWRRIIYCYGLPWRRVTYFYGLPWRLGDHLICWVTRSPMETGDLFFGLPWRRGTCFRSPMETKKKVTQVSLLVCNIYIYIYNYCIRFFMHINLIRFLFCITLFFWFWNLWYTIFRKLICLIKTFIFIIIIIEISCWIRNI